MLEGRGKTYVIIKPLRNPRHRKEDDSVNEFKIDLFVHKYSFWGKEVVSDTNIFNWRFSQGYGDWRLSH